jgi:hypothetical protein
MEVDTMAAITWLPDLEDACEQAERDHKLVLVDFFSPT